MRSVCLIDSSVFCNLLGIPGRCSDADSIRRQFREKVEADQSLLLPLATVLETGNHIAHIADGRVRRKTAERFVEQVRGALEGDAPWTLTPMPAAKHILDWIDQFPDCAKREIGFGDLSILQELRRLQQLSPSTPVYIWTLDHHLAAHNPSD